MHDEAKIQWSEKLAFLLTCPPPPPPTLRHGARARPHCAYPSASPPPDPLPVGVFARAPLPLGASVATIPKSACLTPRTSLLAPYLSASPLFQTEREAEGEADEEGKGEDEDGGSGGGNTDVGSEGEVDGEGEQGEGEADEESREGARGGQGELSSAALVAAVLFERALGAKSRWAAYFGQMPEREDVPVLWGKRKSKELLRGTEIEQAVPSDLAGMRGEWRHHILPFLLSLPPHLLYLLPPNLPNGPNRQHPHDKLPPEPLTSTNQQLPDQLSWDAYLAVKSLISSRAFAIDSWHGHGMVPLADLFNHRTASESVHFTINDEESDTEGSDEDNEEEGGEIRSEKRKDGDKETNGKQEREDSSPEKEGQREKPSEQLEMIMVRGEGPGDEVFNTYGQLSTAALLLRYGFTEPLSFGGTGPKGGTEELAVRLGKSGPKHGVEEEQLECI
ncbi:unnamed protein product, partial [Closterium sp. NIES-53]